MHHYAQRVSTAPDPVRGMRLDPDRAAATRDYEGKAYFFCSPGCAKTFDADPAHYATS